MFYDILQHYFDEVPIASIALIDFEQEFTIRCKYLITFRDEYYVLIEADYIDDFVRDTTAIANRFQVAPLGWLPLIRNSKEQEPSLISPHAKTDDTEGTNDAAFQTYDLTTLRQYGMKYALLKVTLINGD